MPKLALLPIVIATIAAMLTWAMARYRGMVNEQRAAAALRPRSRPYATTLPDSLTRR